ncbi:MAG: helix-turn-helix domain-containing protein [Lachnospiraceae bacterium]|nr:helix-turn-helix domain-containing protein [Lachnospiraceae bacterium]
MDFENTKREIGNRIKELRKANSETQAKLASILHISPDAVAKIEQGKTSLTLENQFAIADHYHVSHDFLCKGVDNSNTLDTLRKFISFSFQTCTVDKNERKMKYPFLKINQALFKYLYNTARANNENIPAKIKDMWVKEEEKIFLNNYDTPKMIELVPVKEDLIFPDDRNPNWSQSNFLREIDKQLDKLAGD